MFWQLLWCEPYLRHNRLRTLSIAFLCKWRLNVFRCLMSMAGKNIRSSLHHKNACVLSFAWGVCLNIGVFKLHFLVKLVSITQSFISVRRSIRQYKQTNPNKQGFTKKDNVCLRLCAKSVHFPCLLIKFSVYTEGQENWIKEDKNWRIPKIQLTHIPASHYRNTLPKIWT